MADLKVGDSGDEVRELQELLAFWDKADAVAVDGHFGPRTEAKLREFQTNNSLPVTGHGDDQSLAELRGIKERGI